MAKERQVRKPADSVPVNLPEATKETRDSIAAVIVAGQAKERQKGGQGGVLLVENLPPQTNSGGATFRRTRSSCRWGGFTIAERRRKALQLETITLKNNWIKMIQLFPPPNR